MIQIKPVTEDDKEIIANWMPSFLHGRCYDFGLAIHRGTDWQLVGLMEDGKICHVGLRDDKGKYFDARGFVEETDIGTGFPELSHPLNIVPITAQQIQHKTDQLVVERARRFSEFLWPDLPWKITEVKSAEMFLNQLETLCRRYGFWMRGGVPATPIYLEQIPNIEVDGFWVQSRINGGVVFDRMLK